MRMPKRPPNQDELIKSITEIPSIFGKVLGIRSPIAAGKYLHWDKLVRYPHPDGLTHEQWWAALKLNRQAQYRQVPLCDPQGKAFQYLLLDPVMKILHEIDLGAGGTVQMPEQVTNSDTRDRYYVSSLIEEAITSSQLEGATTTRQVAKEMIRTGRQPRDKSEQMIYNNYLTMERIGESKDKPLTKDLILDIHRMVTDKTMDDLSAAGRFRRPDEKVYVGDVYNAVFHEPPPAEQLEDRIKALCQFANETESSGFIHPVIRSVILHFWLAYDHPFIDGNGRTARALFYWSMLRHGFWLFEFVSISTILHSAPSKYGRAFLYTETDDNDLTYFIIYHLEVISRAIAELHAYIQRKTREVREAETSLRGMSLLNHRQQSLITHALRHPNQRYTIESHKRSHKVVYQTARLDLLDLTRRRLLHAIKVGKTWHFQPVQDLSRRLAEIEQPV